MPFPMPPLLFRLLADFIKILKDFFVFCQAETDRFFLDNGLFKLLN